MIESLALLLVLVNVIVCDDQFLNTPVYKYRYETQDVMNTAASNVPVHGYHVVEGNYFPYNLGRGGVGIGNGALQGTIAGPVAVGGGFAGPGLGGPALTGPGLGGFGSQYVLKPVGLVGPGGYAAPEFARVGHGGGIGFAGKFQNKFSRINLFQGDKITKVTLKN